MRFLTKFPALVQAAVGLAVTRVGRVYTFMLDWMSIDTVTSVADLTNRFLILVSDDDADGTALYERMSLQDFRSVTQGYVQEITAGGTQAILTTTRLVIVNQTVGAAIQLNLPSAATKIGPVKVVDWKGDAATNNITIAPNGAEILNGAAATWVIGTNNASAVFDPYSGHGYAV